MRSGGLRLRVRLAIALAALSGVTAAVLAGAALVLVERTFDDRFEDRLDAMAAAARRALEERDRFVVSALEDLELALRQRQPELLERWLTRPAAHGGATARAASDWMRAVRLDLLAVLDEGGRVVASGHWEEQAGHALPEAAGLPLGRAVVRPIARRSDTVHAVIARHLVRVGDRQLELVGGRTLDTEFLERLALEETALLYDASGALLGGAGWAAPQRMQVPPRLPAAVNGAVTGESLSFVLAGVPVRARGLDLGEPGGAPGPRLLLAVDRGRDLRLVERLRLAFLAVGVAAVLLAALAGSFVAASVTRPVAALVRAVDGIARGEADYTFPRQADHELDELVQSFSRLDRSLAEQQQRALAAERIAAWREAARRVAHEVKNPLAPIRLTIENLQKARERRPEAFEGMFAEGSRTILDEVARLDRLVSEFSEFARLPAPSRAPADLDALVDAALALHAGDPDVGWSRQGGDAGEVRIDADQISRAVGNVIRNAVEALPGGRGRIEVETGRDAAGAYVEVRDDGTGFTEEGLRRFGEPYFTTKNEGTGLGIAIAARIASEHGGRLVARNRPAGGAAVRLCLAPDDEPGGSG